MTFIGNAHARELLNRTIAGGRTHAVLLTGPAHLGKRTLARLSIEQLVGRKVRPGDPDVLDLGDEVVLPGGIGRESATRIVKHLSRKPVASPRACVLLTAADRLTLEAANTLLVTLEEPAAHALIILTASNGGAVLPTVRSRCVLVPMHEVPGDELRAGLPENAGRDRAVALAAGRPGRAVRLLEDHNFAAALERVRADVEAWSRNGLPARLALAARYGADREATLAFLDEVDLALPLDWRRGLLDARRRLARNVQARAVLEAFAMLQA